MFITKKKHEAILRREIETAFYYTREATIRELRAELNHARDLKAILEKLQPSVTVSPFSMDDCGGTFAFPDHIPQYVPDALDGGRVIKQEATKVITISPEGNVTTGLTKQKPDKGFTYILRREEKK